MKKFKLSLTDEIKGIDKKIASLINQRSRLMCKVSQVRQSKSESLADVGLEKELWIVWKEELKKSNQGLVRQLYTLLNSLGYSMAEKTSSDKPFCLYPPTTPIKMSIPGPRSIRHSHYAAFMSALSPEKHEIKNFLLNDNIIELIKMANQCGFKMSWHENILTGLGSPDLNLDGQSLFVNHSLFNFYLFACLSLGSAGRTKFNSSALLKSVSLRDLQDFMPQLGARLYSIEPQSHSFPVRMEASGQLPSEISIPGHLDPNFVKALILCAPAFEKKFTVKYHGLKDQGFSELISVLKSAGIKVVVDDAQLVVYPGKPFPRSMDIPLDPVLCGFLLAMAQLSLGDISLSGAWPSKSELGQHVLQVLKQWGSTVSIENNAVISSAGPRTTGEMLDLSLRSELAPLAFPLALGTCQARELEIILAPESDNFEIITEVLSHIGYNYSVHSNGINISYSQRSTEKNSPWNSPNPYWTLGYCLLSFKHKGICLANPGNVTSLWPGFWKIFMNLSAKTATQRETKGDINDKPRRKRIRV